MSNPAQRDLAQAPKPPAASAPAPAATPAQGAQWKCTVQGLDAAGQATPSLPENLTIGTKLLLSCEGPPLRLNREKLRIEMDPKATPPLHILQVRDLTETSASLVVAPWLVGEAKIANPTLTDQVARVGLGELQLTIATVIQPEKNPEGKPIPPLLPLTMAWPLWLWIFASAVVVGVLYVTGLVIRHSLRRKRLLSTLEKNAIALSPLNHFNKELRKLMRAIPAPAAVWPLENSKAFFQTLETEFRWFLARELVIPALDGSPGAILGALKKTDRELHKHVARDLRVVLLELRKARAQGASSADDASQLLELSRTVADRIAKERSA